MPSAVAKYSDKTLDLRQLQPTHLVTFDVVLRAVTFESPESVILNSLDPFLLQCRDLLVNPDPFSAASDKSEPTSKGTKDIVIRNILYSGITDTQIEDANKLATMFSLDPMETLRIVVQTCERIPSKHDPQVKKLKSKLPDDRQRCLREERLYIYAKMIFQERRTVIQLVMEMLNNKNNLDTTSTVRNLGRVLYSSVDYMTKIMDKLNDTFQLLMVGDFEPMDTLQEFATSEYDFEGLYYKEKLLYTVDLLRTLVELLFRNPELNNEVVVKWLNLMALTSFMSEVNSHLDLHETFTIMRSLSTLITILVLDVENDDPCYGSDSTTFSQINKIIIDTSNTNAISLYCWSLILLRKYYNVKVPNESSFILTETELAMHINDLNARCISLNIFKSFNDLVGILKNEFIYTAIISSVLYAALPVIPISNETVSLIVHVLKYCHNVVVERFFNNPDFEKFLVVARTKFPMALSPWLKLASINGQFALHEFDELKSLMTNMKLSDISAIYNIDNENSELVTVNKVVDIYPPFETNKKLSLMINANTKAKLLPSSTDEDEELVTFLHKYDGWTFVGRILENLSKCFDATDLEKSEATRDIINLFQSVLVNSTISEGRSVIERASAYTDNSDIIDIIFRIFEQSLHARSIQILVGIFSLLSALLPIMSDRVFPYLYKSSLFSHNDKEGMASNIFAAIELVNGDYPFSEELISFTKNLIIHTFKIGDSLSKMKSTVIKVFIEHLLALFEGFVHCRFLYVNQMMRMGSKILDIFAILVTSVHGIDKRVNSYVSDIFSDSVQRIVESFLVFSNDYSRTAVPLLKVIESLPTEYIEYKLNDISDLHDEWIAISLRFSSLIIDIRSLNDLPPSVFEKQLFTKSSLLVSAYAQYENIRYPILQLISSMVSSKWPEENTPSLLSYLGADHARILHYSIAADLMDSFVGSQLKLGIFDFICAVLKGKQEGLTVLFMSNKDIFESLESSKNDASTSTSACASHSLLELMKKNITEMEFNSNVVNFHFADALSLALNTWTSISEIDNDTNTVEALINRLQLVSNIDLHSSKDYVENCYRLKLGSKLANILALVLFSTQNEACRSLLSKVLTSPEFIKLLHTRFEIVDIGSRVQPEVEAEFQTAFPGFSLDQFVNVFQLRNRFSMDSVYDLRLMDRMFEDKEGWKHIREKVVAASVDWQLIDAQVASTKSFGALLTAFCRVKTDNLDTQFLNTATYLLKLNVIEESLSAPVYEERNELAFFICYSIFNGKTGDNCVNEAFKILEVCSDLLSSTNMNFLDGITSSNGTYRPILRILYFSLNVIKNHPSALVEKFSVLKNVFELAITKAARAILVELQNEAYLFKSKKDHKFKNMDKKLDDLQLILSILKIFMGINLPESSHMDIANAIESNDTVASLLSLYSFSNLIEVNGEHIFAQVSLMFIQEFMTIDIIARKFVASGLYYVLAESPISSFIKEGGLSVSHLPEYHKLWLNGLLPIFLTTLNQLGPESIPEVCLGIRIFYKQVVTCIEAWFRDSSSFTLSTAFVAETTLILLLNKTLLTFTTTEGLILPSTVVELGDVIPVLNTYEKQNDFADAINNLLKHPKFLRLRVVPSTIEEKKLIANKDGAFAAFAERLLADVRELKDYLG